MPMNEKLIAGIELGGTKSIAIIARGHSVIDEIRIPTTSPYAVFKQLSDWLISKNSHERIDAIGIASFGPLCLDKASPIYGYITTTPKPNWGMVNVLGPIKDAFPIPIGFDTDVNGAALAEYYWGGAKETRCSIYVTIGTGIGGGVIINGTPLHGLSHPEMGHVKIRRKFQTDFKGVCPFHNDCLEGLASGPAIAARTGIQAQDLDESHEIWEILGDELGEFVTNLILTFSPQKIALGGGVMNSKVDLIPKIRKSATAKLANYIDAIDAEVMSKIIGAPELGDKAGPMGAIAIGIENLLRVSN